MISEPYEIRPGVFKGGPRLAFALSGRTIGKVSIEGGWVTVHSTDGLTLHIEAEYGQSLVLTLTEATEIDAE